MQFGYSEACLGHDPGPRHPETPDRLRAIRERLKRKHGVEYVEPDPATIETITRIHDREYIESLEEFCANGGGNWDPDTTAVEESWDAIRCSAGAACWAVDAALEGADGRETPFSIGRPPGHHAVYDDAMGFCFVNNVAVASQYAIETYDSDRVAVVDWDVHHGNGTQDIFYDNGDIFFASIHEQGLYPGTGDVAETGTGDGAGATMNVPIPAGSDEVDYLAAIDGPVTEALEAFDPELLLISAGFDAHQHDPISRIRLSTEAYALMTDRFRSIAANIDAPIAFVLEGGYGLEVLADSVALVHETFDGREPIEPDGNVSEETSEILERVADVHDLEFE